MTRRDLLKAGIALGTAGSATAFADDKVRRVGLIGCGWYGKSDLLRMVQVSPIEVVSLCDVDSKMLSDAADLVSTRQRSKKKPRLFSDYREMLQAGFRTTRQGVVMERNAEPGYNRREVFLIDDWR